MRRIFLDPNIIIDLIDDTRANHQDALRLKDLLKSQKCHLLCAWHSLPILEYVCRKNFAKEDVHQMIKSILSSFLIPKTGSDEAREAFQYLDDDYEDALQVAAAVAGNSDFLVSRDQSGFKNSPIPVVTPEGLCDALS